MGIAFTTSFMVAAAFAFVGVASQAADEMSVDDEARHERLDFIRKRLAEFSLFFEDRLDEPLKKTEEPVLRYSNPVRNFFSDGATFLWLDERRPVAAASISIRGAGNVAREFTSLIDKPLHCVRDERVVWRPKSGGLLDQPLEEAQPPAASASLRLAQMRRLGRRFSAQVVDPETDEMTELRLLTQPLYRYTSPERGTIDGGLFAFVLTNDPDVLLLLEAVGDAGEPTGWRYSLARMSAPPVEVSLDETPIWSVRGYWTNPRSPEDPYMEAVEGRYQPEAPVP